ncbi:AraC family transcriptional regulator [Psychromonas sp. psych-6C06]|uniref:helix-turn-helix transcriptional regulator n=1 Tax=Psychromonas sp. psych-6C06 TaxID=2058089 RepID=UPI000C323135|nr:AraC family transcriptional regulator [Psychromonas sp. psych-6C06]PKF62318.1 AraC family transcriptional regulator [Psychromonas sp. psych-6C06]
MKPSIEKISHKPDFGWRIQYYHGCDSQFDWHYHFEYELALHRNFSGQKFVGDYIGPIEHNDLSLYGPKLPHTVTFENCPENADNETYIIWFSQSWVNSLINTFPEMQPLKAMLDGALQGIQFSSELSERVFSLLVNHQRLSPALAVANIIEILVLLSESPQSKRLNSYHQQGLQEQGDKELKLVEKISLYIEKNYRNDIKLVDLCNHIHVSKSTVSRLFERHFLSSFSQHLAEYRLGKACELLVNSDTSIAVIADMVGFNNISNFNRHFKVKKQMSPKQFRNLFSQ